MNEEELTDQITSLKKSRKYKKTKYRDPRIYKVGDGIEIRYLNETQTNDPATKQKIIDEKIKLIDIFKNEK
jgi:hypothetical protein